jgi:hypothetical protein
MWCKIIYRAVCLTALLALIQACAQPETEAVRGRVVAKAGAEQLSFERFRRELIQSPYVKDSSFNARRTIESWATQSLLYQEALNKLRDEEMQIEEQVQDYRKALVNFIYENKLVEVNLDTTVSNEEIESYYRQHRNSFILKENIVKVDYIKVPLRSTGLDKIKKLLKSTKPREQEQLPELLAQNAENFFLNDSTWLYIQDIRNEIPQLRDEPDYMLGPGRSFEFTDNEYFYYLKVKDIKTKNALSPLTFERSNIRKFILNARKTQLISEYRRELLERAKKDKSLVVYESPGINAPLTSKK